jgi:uncharacterized protein YcaQ
VVTTLEDIRHRAVMQTMFPLTTLKRAMHKLGFVQADPIRAPARAQDLVLRHRVEGYRVGDLERRYARLDVQEEYFVNYGFVTSALQALMHPRTDASIPAEGGRPWHPAYRRQALRVLEFVRQRTEVHPREVEERFAQGTVTNYWGGSSNATTHLLDAMLYRGLVRVTRRERGIRVYAAHSHGPEPAGAQERDARLDALADAAVRLYAPLTVTGLARLLRRLRFAVPQWQAELTPAIRRARERLAGECVQGVEWCWPAGGGTAAVSETVRFLAPFDPVVWDRGRFALLWGWDYRFEAYTVPSKRRLGYYALPLLWRDRVIGWGNLSLADGELEAELGYTKAPPRDRAFKRELAAELDRLRSFLGLAG